LNSARGEENAIDSWQKRFPVRFIDESGNAMHGVFLPEGPDGF
jgi:hypothetical protein